MAIIEKTGILTYVDGDGNEIRLYPKSKSGTTVDGADAVISLLDIDWELDETTGLYKQVFTVTGLTSESTPVIGLVPTATPTPDAEIEAYSHIIEAVTSEDTLTLYADEALSIAIVIVVKGIAATGGSTVADITNMTAAYNELKGKYEALNSNLGNVPRFVDYSKVIHSITTQGSSWVATEDCFCCATVGGGTTSNGATVKINGVYVFGHTLSNNIRMSFYVKSGQTVATKENYGTYNLEFYALL